MSSIEHDPDLMNPLGSLGSDGIRRYKTRCKILVDSHLHTETISIIDDVFAVQMSKTIKGNGQATFSLIPSENWMNIIFPNDYVNIYFDIGDGSGWTRTFFGLIDRVEEEYKVAKDGKPNTVYKVVCSDFYKVVEKTLIYFNPHMQQREDFQNFDIAEINIAGLALMSKGIVYGGSPPDILQNLLHKILGFGTQFMLPPSYSPGSVQKKLRERRYQDNLGRISPEAAKKLTAAGGYLALKKKIQEAKTKTAEKFGKLASVEEQRKQVAESLGIELRTGKENIQSVDQLIQEATDKDLRDIVEATEAGLTGGIEAATEGILSTFESTVSEKSYLIDILDLYSFVETRAIDGYLFGQPVWQSQGPLINILRSISNEPINELFLDLRPLSANSSETDINLRPLDGNYARIADDKQANDVEGDSAEAGITYVPAVVMREYPFSTIDGLDLSEVELQLDIADGKKAKVGKLQFGAIFSDRPNVPGRHVIDVGNINVDDFKKDETASDEDTAVKGESSAKAYKNLDVAVISEKEIVGTTLGRSDSDHFNLFEFYSDAILGTDQRFYMRDILPIITPIHILRNGLRVRSVTTRAARFSVTAQKRRVDETQKLRERAEKINQTEDSSTDLAVFEGPPGLPIDPQPDVVVFYNGANADWGYRPKPKRTLKNGKVIGLDKWVFHQGIDITKRQPNLLKEAGLTEEAKKDYLIPVKAIADGWIVVSSPTGGKEGYGNHVVIKHKFPEPIGFRYSVYGHLLNFTPQAALYPSVLAQKVTDLISYGRFNVRNETPGIRKGQARPKEVKKGEIIGYMGNTGFTPRAPDRQIHLHFEIDRHWPPKNDDVTRRIPFSEVPESGPTPAPPSGFTPTGVDTEAMLSAKQNSADPVEFYRHFDVDLVNDLKGTNPSEEVESESEDQDNGNNSAEEKVNRPKPDVQQDTGKVLTETKEPELTYLNRVDSASTRTQIIRWALLQDHWYQHNLEYLSGRIDMRGAPEIRVGYRLDLKERNMSFYVEGVNHSWTYPNSMKTSLSVSRGQPNNPYPIYVLPPFSQLGATASQRKTSRSRLATYFVTPDPIAIRRSLFVQGRNIKEDAGFFQNNANVFSSPLGNLTDRIDSIEYDTDTREAEKYGEIVIPANSRPLPEPDPLAGNEEAEDNTTTSTLKDFDGGGIPRGGN